MLKTTVVLATFIIVRNCVTKHFYDFYHATLYASTVYAMAMCLSYVYLSLSVGDKY